MLFLVLKLILVLVLTMIPIMFGVFVKPKQKTSEKCRNLYSFIGAYSPMLERKYRKIRVALKALWYKIKNTENGRKFFTCILVLVLLSLQYVDYLSSNEVAAVCKDAIITHNEKVFMVTKPNTTLAMVFGVNTFSNYWYPYITPAITYLIAMVTTLLLFSDKIASKILSNIYHKPILTFISVEMIWLLSILDEGKNILLAEMLFVLLLAGMIYPIRKNHVVPHGGITIGEENRMEQKKAA